MQRRTTLQRQTKPPRLLTPLLIAAALFLLAGCGLLSGEREAENDGSSGGNGGDAGLDDELSGPISDLDPATATDRNSLTVLGNVGEGLYRLDENGEPEPGMAESVSVSEDRLTYEFKLREGVEWSSGELVTAGDFEYAWLRTMNPDTIGGNSDALTGFIENSAAYNAGEVEREEVGVEATDERTLEVRLGRPVPFFLDLTALPVYLPLKERFVEQWGEDFATSTDSLLYNGPYEMTGFEAARGMRLEKREGYWDAKNVSVGLVDGRVIGGSSTARYESGNLDIATLGPGEIPEYETEKDFERRTDLSTFALYLNPEDPAMSNLKLRKAVQTGFDREILVDDVLGDGSLPAYGYVPYGMSSGSADDNSSETFRESVGDTVPGSGTRKSGRLWARGAEELGREPTLTVLIGDGTLERELGESLRDQLSENLGTRVEVRVVPEEDLTEHQAAGEYQISASKWNADYDDPESFLAPQDPASPLNYLRSVSPRYDTLVNEILTAPSSQQRAEMFVEAERVLVREEALVAPIYYPGNSYLIKPGVKYYVTPGYGTPVIYRHTKLDR